MNLSEKYFLSKYRGYYMSDKPITTIPSLPTNVMFMPLLSRKKFSELLGLPESVVSGWIARGYIKTVSVGKYSLVSLSALHQKALEDL